LGTFVEVKTRQVWLWAGAALVVTAAGMTFVTSVVNSHNSAVAANLSATRFVAVSAVNGPNFSYYYAAKTGSAEFECIGDGTHNPPLKIGAQIRIFYDPSRPCDNLSYDPVPQQRSDLKWLLVFCFVLPLVVASAVWDAGRPH
jgi:hypothetical protein